MKITFLVNFPSRHPFGGYKIIYEYANFLSSKGHNVTIVYQSDKAFSSYKMPYFIRYLLSVFFANFGPSWFPLSKNIKRKVLKEFNVNKFPDGDCVIATAVDTAEKVYSLPPTKGKKYYFIQHFEDWVFDKEKVLQTYKLGMKNIVIAKRLKCIVDQASGRESIFIPNGINNKSFYITTPIRERNPFSIAALYHDNIRKGSKDSIYIFKELKKRYPGLVVNMFGVPKRPDYMPCWIKYTQNANINEIRDIYNESAIFLCSSWSEGFGLTGAESIFCGCALVSTDTQGVREYADENYSIICNPKDVNSLINGIISLFENNDKRCRIAEMSNECVTKKLSHIDACQSFEKALLEN